MKRRSRWQSFHRWAGLLFAVFLLVFCISGIILNHREAFAGCGVSRSVLPPAYHIKDYNNGIIKGTALLADSSLLAYGNGGIWLTDRDFSRFTDFNAGLPDGADRRNIRNVVRTPDGSLWAAAQYGLYRHDGTEWKEINLSGNHARLTDVTLAADGKGIIALTRDGAYRVADGKAAAIDIKAPEGYRPEASLFKTVWMLHSGELFGMAGRIVVDIIALVIAFLSVTGIILFILPYPMRRAARKALAAKAKRLGGIFKWNFRWHDRTGYWMLVLTLLIAVTGTCLRPPLMIPLVLTKTAPLPGSALDSPNPWHDRMRVIRYDASMQKWILSTSEGFYTVDTGFSGRPVRMKADAVPPVSPMGINVMHQENDSTWIVGSFSGIFRWNPQTGSVTDYMSGKPYERKSGGRPVASDAIAGFSADTRVPAVFDYAKGTPLFGPTDPKLASSPLSLWNTALELHVGRCYSPFLGPVSDLFVFIAGMLLIFILISGYMVHRRATRRKTKSTRQTIIR